VEINAFSMDISKVLQTAEILKTRVPFLYQETKMITRIKEFPKKSTEEDGRDETVTKVYSGISVTLSLDQFKVSDLTGY
jgi:hypothetical protein